jgi:polyvinyl alcohol dehydrogenase (cytochrome)
VKSPIALSAAVPASALWSAAGCDAERPVAFAQAAPPAGKADQPPAAPAAEPAESEPGRLRIRHADPKSAVNAGNVSRLTRAWSLDTGSPVTHRPLMHDGKLHFGDWDGRVWAVRADDGEVVWKRQIEQPKTEWPWHGFAGTGAIGGGMLFEASAEGTAFALDAGTGEVKWKTRFTDDPQAGSISDLLYHDGMVYIGVSSVEEMLAKQAGFKPDFQGRVVALDAKTGDKVWDLALALPPHTGAAMWSSFALDPEMDALFFTTSNNYTQPANQLSDAIIAVRAKTGEMLWANQVTQNDVWTVVDQKGPDYAFGAGAQLFEAQIGGQTVKLLGAGQKSGVFYALDRLTGRTLWTTVVGYGGKAGGIHDEASLGDGRIFVWSNNSYTYGKPPEEYPANVKRLDAATGDYVWVRTEVQPASTTGAGFLAGDVYFTPSMDGKVRAYRAPRLEIIWTSEPAGPVSTALWVYGDRLCFAAGMPKKFGGEKGSHQVICYRLGDAKAADAGR